MHREGPGSAVDAFEPAIRHLLAMTPDMPATVIAERIGWTRGITILRERVAELRPAFQVPEAFGRTEYKGHWWFGQRRRAPVGLEHVLKPDLFRLDRAVGAA
jgi:hypothetical protein